jgi:hypothetical protein
MSTESLAESTQYWDVFAADAASLNAPLYARLAAGVRGEEQEKKCALDDMLVVASVRRPLFRLSLERANGDFPLTLTRYADGAATSKVLAMAGPQGSWLEWR